MELKVWPYLVLLALLPAIALLYGYAFRRRRQAVLQLVSAELAPRLVPGTSRGRRWAKVLCLVVAAGCLIVGLMQPRWGEAPEDIPREGRDLIVLLDVSLSMLAEDVAPNRLAQAKQAVRTLVEALARDGGHRLGLLAFAGRASIQTPLTLDYDLFLERLDEVGPESVARRGTALGDALRQALEGFGRPDPAFTDLVLVTDGEDHGSLPMEAARAAGTHQVGLYVVGVGDPAAGAAIPIEDAEGHRSHLEFEGQEVRSRQHEALLRDIAQTAGGTYVDAALGPEAIVGLYQDHIAGEPRRQIVATTSAGLAQQYHWFVLAALLFLMLETVLRDSTGERPA